MENMGVIEWVAFFASIASLILALVAISASRSSEKEVRENFEKTQKVMAEYQEKTKEVLAEIDKKSAIIEKTVSDSQTKLMDTMTHILNETAIPKKADPKYIMQMQFLKQFADNPDGAKAFLDTLSSLQKNKKDNDKS